MRDLDRAALMLDVGQDLDGATQEGVALHHHEEQHHAGRDQAFQLPRVPLNTRSRTPTRSIAIGCGALPAPPPSPAAPWSAAPADPADGALQRFQLLLQPGKALGEGLGPTRWRAPIGKRPVPTAPRSQREQY